MIEYTNAYDRLNLMFFSEDGSYGSADDIVIIDTTEIDGHFQDVIDNGDIHESERQDFMRWFVENQTHDKLEGEYGSCEICDRWKSGTEDEIQEELEEEGE
jgi:hypothetical protein